LECPAEGPNPLKGDLLVFGGATLYAVSNVTEVSANPQLSALQCLKNMTEVYMCAILIYAFLSTKFQEYIVKKGSRVELMAMLGVFGAVISAIQMYPLA
jgi:solute carrier family 35 protein F1/2